MRSPGDRPSSPDTQALLEKLYATCQEVSTPYTRGRDELFKKVGALLVGVYRAIAAGFRQAIACRTRRMLLLTAAPFQLCPQEILELLRISDDMHPGADACYL